MISKNKDDIILEEIPSPFQENLKEDLKLKLVVGKTNLISWYIHNLFQQETKATIGVEFFCKTFKVNNSMVVKIEICDTVGQERYKSMTSVYYKGAKGAFIVYDITSRKSFDNVDKWIEEIKEKIPNYIKLLVIGNKIDLNEQRVISTEEAKYRYKDMDIPVIETLALNDADLEDAFINIVKIIYEDYIRQGENDDNLTSIITG